MSIVKANVESNYTVMTNQAAQDTQLSLESKGLLLLMVSRPSDWVFHKSQLKKECGIGTDKINRLFKELIGRGYLCATQNFDEHGRFSKSEYILFADSASNPAYVENTGVQPWPEKPLTVNPSTANQQLQKKDYLQKKDNTNKGIVVSTPKFDFKSVLIEMGANEEAASDWMVVRKKKKASNTKTALKGFLTQVQKAGITVQQAVEIAAGKSWSGFQADWYRNSVPENKDILATSAASDWHLEEDQGF